MIKKDYSIDAHIDKYQSIFESALSKADFSIGTGIYMLPSNLNLNMGKTVGYNNKILISKDTSKLAQIKILTSLILTIKSHLWPHQNPVSHMVLHIWLKAQISQQNPVDDQKMLSEKHNDEKIVITFLIMGDGLIIYHFW